MSNIHVLHVLNSTSGGSALSTFELIEHLKSYNVKSSLLCYRNGSDELRTRISNLVEGRVLFLPLYWMNKKIRAKWWKRPAIEALSIWQTGFGYKHLKIIKEFAVQNKINLVHSSTILNPEGAILSKKFNLPHIWHCRELIGPGKPYQFYFFKQWVNWVQLHANRIIANSNLTFKELSKYFIVDKLLTINNGIDPDRFQFKKHYNNRPIVVGMLGNLTTRWKNHELFIRIAQHMYGVDNLKFNIYGKLPDHTDHYLKGLKRKIQSNPNIKLVGYTPAHEALKEIDIMFHPSFQESFGRVIIEAMASGIPVIGMDQGAQKYIIDDGLNGYLLNGSDESGIIKAIKDLGENESMREAMGIRGRKKVEEEYHIKKQADKIIRLYHELATHHAIAV